MEYFKDKALQEHVDHSELVIFDYNGLIVDDEPLQLRAFNTTLQEFDIDITEEFFIDEVVGNRPTEAFTHILNYYHVDPGSYDIKDVVETFRSSRASIKVSATEVVREGVIDLIGYLVHCKKHVAIGSSSKRSLIERSLSELGLDDTIELIVASEDVNKGKPNPEVYLKVAKHFSVPAERSLVLEDSAKGIEAAVRAGMRCFAVPNRFTQEQDFSKATFVIDSLEKSAKPL